jgi:hypothetical protein
MLMNNKTLTMQDQEMTFSINYSFILYNEKQNGYQNNMAAPKL